MFTLQKLQLLLCPIFVSGFYNYLELKIAQKTHTTYFSLFNDDCSWYQGESYI